MLIQKKKKKQIIKESEYFRYFYREIIEKYRTDEMAFKLKNEIFLKNIHLNPDIIIIKENDKI